MKTFTNVATFTQPANYTVAPTVAPNATEQAFSEISGELADILKFTRNNVGDESIKTVNARDLHKALGVGKDFSTWVKDKIEKNRLVEGFDYVKVGYFDSPNLGSKSHGGQNKVEYFFTFKAGQKLALLQNNIQGDRVREYFIAAEEELQESKVANRITIPDFTNPYVAAMAWAEQYQAAEVLKLA